MQFDLGAERQVIGLAPVDLTSHRNFWSTLEFNSIRLGDKITAPAGLDC